MLNQLQAYAMGFPSTQVKRHSEKESITVTQLTEDLYRDPAPQITHAIKILNIDNKKYT